MEISYILLGLAFVVGYLCLRQRKKQMRIFKDLGIPGPKPHLLWGNLPDIITKGYMTCLVEWHEKYGDVVGVYFGVRPFVCVADPEILRTVLLKEAMKFPDKDSYVNNFGIFDERIKLFMEGQKGQEWKNLRALLSPTFSTGKLKQLMPIIQKKIEELLSKVDAQSSKSCVDLKKLLAAAAMDISLSVFSGIDANLQDNPNQKLAKAIRGGFSAKFSNWTIKLLLVFPSLDNLLSIIPNAFWKLLGDPVSGIFDKGEVVYRARLDLKEYPRKDVLQLLIDYNKEIAENESAAGEEKRPLSDDQIVSNAFGFVMAGHDTVSSLISFTSYLLTQHPDIQEKVRKEVREIMGTKGTLEYDDLVKMQYLDQVLSEVLRLFPASPNGVVRTAEEDFEIRGKNFPKSIPILSSIPFLHYSSKFWDNPRKFDPERFGPEGKNSIVPMSYLPFGAGPRMCIGMKLAQVTSRMIVAYLLANFRLEKCSDADKEWPEVHESMFIISPKTVQCRIHKIP